MASYPYYLTLQAILAASGSGTMQFPVPQGQTLDIAGIRQNSTGAFVVTDIRTSDGVHYTNASVSVPIPNDVFQDSGSPNIQFTDMPELLHVEGGTILYIDVRDTSAAPNTVNIILACKLTLPGS